MIPYQPSDNALRIFHARYLDEEAKTPDDLFRRVSGGNDTYYRLMKEGLFLPNSPTLFNAGKKEGGTLSACFTSDTVIHTLAGDYTVKEIIDKGWKEFEVFSCNGRKLKIGRAFNLRKTRDNAKIYRVKFDTGDKIKLTADHLVMLRNGTYKEVRHLKKGDSVMPFNFSYQNYNGAQRRFVCPKISDRRIPAYRWAFKQKNGFAPKYKIGDIHHIDHNPQNDSTANLQFLTNSEHASLHMSENNPMHNPEVVAKISGLMKGNQRGVGPKPGTAKAMKGNQHALKTEQHPDPKRQYQREWARKKSREKRGLHNHKVVSVKFVGREDVYDLSVHKYHNFAANGIFIHNCFVFDIDDCLLGDWPDGGIDSPFPNSILGTTFKAACVAKAGGGVGYYLGNIREEGALVRSTHKRACGPVTVARFLHGLRALITQGGKRDLAQMGVLPVWHTDILKFIHMKDDDPQSLSSFNISVSWPDKWMEKVQFDKLANLTTQYRMEDVNDETRIWWEQCNSAWKTGDPGMLFFDAINRWNATPHLGDINATNPCGETPNLNNEPCNLGSSVLFRFLYKAANGTWQFAWDAFKQRVKEMIRFLDDILDWNLFPHPDITKMSLATRKLGLGVMGYADLLAIMRIPYDSNDGVNFGREVMRVIANEALYESISLAHKKGPYPAFEEGKSPSWAPWCRNSTRTSIAPTGTISLLADCSSGIEPHFALEWDRTTNEGIKLKEKIQVAEYLDGGFVPKIAQDIELEWHIKHQAAFQQHTDLGVSKTINLPNNATVHDISKAYQLMWQYKCKGGTVYRDGCRDEQVLVSKKTNVYTVGQKTYTEADLAKKLEENWKKARESSVMKIPDASVSTRRKLAPERKGTTKKFKIGGTKGYVTANEYDDGTLAEIFIVIDKQGSTLDGFLDAFARTFSMSLQYGTPLGELVKLHKGSRFEPYGITGDPAIPNCASIVDYVVRWLEIKYAKPSDTITVVTQAVLEIPNTPHERSGTGSFCPDCGCELYRSEGCMKCPGFGCGFSKC
jgi:ribonucleoside-diphosphate reductase alpha chain